MTTAAPWNQRNPAAWAEGMSGVATRSADAVAPGGGRSWESPKVAAWRQSMTAGAQGGGDSCGGCSDDHPCASCGQTPPVDSPAYQALGWGLGAAAKTQDPFWRAVIVGQALRDAPARDHAPEWPALQGMVHEAINLRTVQMQGINANSAVNRVITPSDDYGCDPELRVPGGDGWPNINPVPVGDPVGEPECCPILVYPVPTPKPFHYAIPGGWAVGHTFEAYAIYKDEPPRPGPYCSCNCCVFRQYVDTKKSGTNPDGTPFIPLPYNGPDYGRVPGQPPTLFGNKGETQSCKSGGDKPKSCEDYTRQGGTPPMTKEGAASLAEELKKVTTSYCIYSMRDHPWLEILYGGSASRDDCFIGKVKDRCHKCAEKATGTFSLYVSASVDWLKLDQQGRVSPNKWEQGALRMNPEEGHERTCTIPDSDKPDCPTKADQQEPFGPGPAPASGPAAR